MQKEIVMTNEQEFFNSILKLEKIKHSEPLTDEEIGQIQFDVSRMHSLDPLIDFVRRIEHAHGIGVNDE